MYPQDLSYVKACLIPYKTTPHEKNFDRANLPARLF
jgi:hypothetical protein